MIRLLISLVALIGGPYGQGEKCGFVHYLPSGEREIIETRDCVAYDLAGSNGAKGPDGSVDDKDISVMLSNTSPTCPPCPPTPPCATHPAEDVNGDGTIDSVDFTQVFRAAGGDINNICKCASCPASDFDRMLRSEKALLQSQLDEINRQIQALP